MKGKWICSCTAGECSFGTENEALEANHGKFCGRNVVVIYSKPTVNTPNK